MSIQTGRSARCTFTAALIASICGSAAFAQLNPPPGPVSPSMKRLDQIEPRICLNDLEGSPDSVILVRFPGKYYLTANVHGQSGKHGILVDPSALDGDVSIDLNGFALVGVQGSLDGIHGHGGGGGGGSGGSLSVTSDRDRPRGYASGKRIFAWGDNGVDIADCRACVVSGLDIDQCGGAGVIIEGVQDADTNNDSVTRCASGIEILPGANAGVPGRCDARVMDVTVRDCFGAGVTCRGVIHWQLEVRAHRIEMKRCAGPGLVLDTCEDAEVGECLVADCDGDGIQVTSCQRLLFQPEGTKGVRVRGCTGNGVTIRLSQRLTLTRSAFEDCDDDGLHVEDCDDLRCEDVTVADCDGDGFDCLRTATVDARGPVAVRCGGRGLHFDTCTSVALHRVAVGDVNGDGIACQSVADLDCDGQSEIARCGGNGVELLDCDDADCSDLRVFECGLDGWHDEDCDDVSLRRVTVADCDGDGIDSSWTAASAGHVVAIGHDYVEVSRCLGAGIRCVNDAPECVMSVTQTGCEVSMNSGAGCRVAATATGRIHCVCTQGWYHDNGGQGLIWSPRSNIALYGSLTDCRCSSNGGDGFSCVSSTQGAIMSSSCRVDVTGSSFTANGGSGCVSQCPMQCTSSSFCENIRDGLHLTATDPLTSIGSSNGCTFARNGGNGVHCARGRYAHCESRVEDCGGDGVRCDDGCVIMTNSTTNRCGGNGLTVSGTLTVDGSSFRRCGGSGVSCSNGSCTAERMVCELNGVAGTGGGGAEFLDCSSVTLDRCTASQNFGNGVTCSSGAGITGQFNPKEMTLSRNGVHGLDLDDCAGGQVVACRATGNGGMGILLRPGFTGGLVERCACTSNGGGMLVEGTGNMVFSNTATCGPLGCMTVVQGNHAGPMVDPATLSTDCNPRSNFVH